MMNVLLFDLDGGAYALKLEAIERILAPGETPPSGRRPIDLAVVLGMRPVRSPHTLLMAQRDAALLVGAPIETAAIEPSWILPLPGYMFRAGRPPYRGLIEAPSDRVPARRTLLLDEEALVGTDR